MAFLDNILNEIAHRLDNGKPDWTNEVHVRTLVTTLVEMNLPDEFITEFVGNLMEASALDKELTWTDEESGEKKTGTARSVLQGGNESHPAWDEAQRLKTQDDSDKENDAERESDTKAKEKEKEKEKTQQEPEGEPKSDDAGPNLWKGEPNGGLTDGEVDAIKLGKEENQPKTEKRIIDGKDKTLNKNINPVTTKFYNEPIEPTDDSFDMANKPYENITPPPKFVIDEQIIQNSKVPKKYFNVLQRMINTKATMDSAKLSHFISDGGAGQTSAQAGEIMTMMATTMDDASWNQLQEQIQQHEASLLQEDKVRIDNGEKPIYHKVNSKGILKDNPGSRIVDKSWVQAANNNRTAILNRIYKNHPNATIVAGGWDTEQDFESLGGSDYSKNKGFSTDVYFRVKTADGNDILDEVSLKKSKIVNFLNSGTGEFLKWDPEIAGTAIDPQQYGKDERENLVKGARDVFSSEEIEKNPILKAAIEATEETTKYGKRGANRKNSKIILKSIERAAGDGSTQAQMYIDKVNRDHQNIKTKSIKALMDNPKLKEGLLSSIRQEFPLKAVSSGEETMAIGDMSFDPDTMTEIFGTSDYDEIKEKLVALEDANGNPYLGYRAEVKGKVIPLSNIVVRQDGVGYGGSSIKFEMKLHPEMAKMLKTATENVYGVTK